MENRKVKQVKLLIDQVEISTYEPESGYVYILCEAFWPITTNEHLKIGTFMVLKDEMYWKNLDDPDCDYLVHMMISEEIFEEYFDEYGHAYDDVQLVQSPSGATIYALLEDEYHRIESTLYEGGNFIVLVTDKGLAVGYSAIECFCSDYAN